MRKLFLFIVCFILFGVGIKAQRFPQAVLPGDYPDPSILRDGKNYYMTHSPFIMHLDFSFGIPLI